jgi:hypothetical protein
MEVVCAGAYCAVAHDESDVLWQVMEGFEMWHMMKRCAVAHN